MALNEAVRTEGEAVMQLLLGKGADLTGVKKKRKSVLYSATRGSLDGV